MLHSALRMRLLFVLALFGCEKDLLAELPDAPIPDASTEVCPTPTQPLPAAAYKLYLQTEGVTLYKCGDDSRTNCTDLITTTGTVVPPFLEGVATRQEFIANIVAAAQDRLASYSIDIVTERPASGNYYMFVVGGSPSVSACTPDAFSCTPFSCAPTNRNAVDMIFDRGLADPPGIYASSLLSDLGALVGMTATVVPDDCECRFDTPCTMSSAEICSFGRHVETTKAVTNDDPPLPLNCGTQIQDEPAILKLMLGCR